MNGKALTVALADIGRALPGDLARATRQRMDLRRSVLIGSPPPVLVGLVRRFRPVLNLSNLTLITRHDDVIAVLGDPQRFSVTPYARTMNELAGPFLLGQDGVQHDTARRRLEGALAPIAGAALETWANKAAEELVAARTRNGRLDVVTDLAWRLPARFAAGHLGVPGPDEDSLIGWSRALFEGIFLNLDGQRGVAVGAAAAADELGRHIDGILTGRPDAPSPTGVLRHLVEARPETPAAQIRSDLVGLLVGAIPTVAECIARVINDLLDRPETLGRVRAAAEQDDQATLWRYARESLRLNPQSPGVIRATSQAVGVGDPGNLRGRLAEGSRVMASSAAAMRDPAVVARPSMFDAHRPDTAYLHFGHGVHRCLGQHSAPALITAAMRAVFRNRGLRRASGTAGRLAIEGPWPTRLVVALDRVTPMTALDHPE